MNFTFFCWDNTRLVAFVVEAEDIEAAGTKGLVMAANRGMLRKQGDPRWQCVKGILTGLKLFNT